MKFFLSHNWYLDIHLQFFYSIGAQETNNARGMQSGPDCSGYSEPSRLLPAKFIPYLAGFGGPGLLLSTQSCPYINIFTVFGVGT
jgi:hypothetical protein